MNKSALLLSCLLIGHQAGAASEPAKIVEAACAAVPPPAGPALDLKELRERIEAGQARNVAGLEDSCRGWRQVVRDATADTLLRTDWEAMVASSLVWLGRSGEAEPLFDAAYGRYAAAGLAQVDKAGTVAAMLAVISLQRAQVDAALAWSQRAVDAAASSASMLTVSEKLRLRLNHASLLSNVRRFEQARLQLQGLLEEALAQPVPLAAEAAAALGNLASLAARESRLEEALAYTEREIALRQAQVSYEPVSLATAMHNRGLLLMNLARFDEAEAALQAALRQARDAQAAGAVDLMGHQASVRETLSGLLLARGRAAEALQMAKDAVAALAGQPQASTARGARPLRRLAEAQLALGEIGEGVATYRHALALLATATGATEVDTAVALRMGYAMAMIELGDLEEAEATLKVLASGGRPLSPEEQARLQGLRASLAQRQGDPAAAARAWLAADEALAATLPAEHPSRRFIQIQACELKAVACPQESDVKLDNTVAAEVLTQMSLARRARATGRADAAESAARIAVSTALASGQPRLQWQALALWAELRADVGRREEAIFLGKLALKRLQQQRQRLLPLGAIADARYLADKAPLYRRVADWLLQARRLPEALEVMRLLKVQEQADFNERGSGEAAGGGSLDLSPAEQAAGARFEAALRTDSAQAQELRSLSERAAAQRITPQEAVRLAQLRQDDARQRDARLASLAGVLAMLQSSSRTASAPAAGIARKPPAGQLHVYTLAGERHLTLLLVGSAGTQVRQIDLPASQLTQQVAALRDALAAPGSADAVQPLAEALYAQLGRWIDAAAKRERARQIVVWLDGPLRYLPPGLLHDGREPLALRYRWVVAGGLAQAPAATSSRDGPRITAFGVTQSLQGLPALPGVADEVCDIVDGPVLGLEEGVGKACGASSRGHGPLRGEGLLNALFTESALSRGAAGLAPADLLHIGTHFVLRPGSVARSWLLLGDGQRLPLAKIHKMKLGAPRLVTLSACETAVVDVAGNDGREVDGLAAALLDNGASEVLASLWRVDDQATARFMRRFYAAYARDPRHVAVAALQQAQREAIAEGAPARDWAAFVLMARAHAR